MNVDTVRDYITCFQLPSGSVSIGLEEIGLPRMRFHDVRHTAATILLVAGVHPKLVQERLGHSTVAMTLDVYSHVLPSMQQEVAVKIDGLFKHY